MLTAILPEPMDEAHRRNYILRIGANLAKDRFRLMRRESEMPKIEPAVPDTSKRSMLTDLVNSAFAHLRAEDRQLLWLAYAEEMSHKEIAPITGYRVGSVQPLLSQARRRLATVVLSILRMTKMQDRSCDQTTDVRAAMESAQWRPDIVKHALDCEVCQDL